MLRVETRRAVVLGGGIVGMLTAAALTRHMDEVIVIDRDDLPDRPAPRAGVPQGRHTHLLLSGGARAMEGLLPGLLERLQRLGARRIGYPHGCVELSVHGWQHRFPGEQFLIACSRDLLDWCVRDQALRLPGLRLRPRTEAAGYNGWAGHVTGALVRDRTDGRISQIDADLVIEATGRGAHLQQRLAVLGVRPVREERVDAGFRYATRVYRAPSTAPEDFPLLGIHADPRLPVPGQNAVLMPIEGGRWSVTLSGARGGEPSVDEEGFERGLCAVRTPVFGDLVASAEPLGAVRGSRSTGNCRRFCEEHPTWPDGLVVIGDALVALNPVYGQGMSVGALCAEALHHVLRRRGGLDDGAAHHIQRALGQVASGPWAMAAGQDVWYSGCTVDSDDPRLNNPSVEERAQMDQVAAAALCDPDVSAAWADVASLAAPPDTLAVAHVTEALEREPRHPALYGPPFAPEELRFLRGERRPAPQSLRPLHRSDRIDDAGSAA